ncbi:mRNA cap guanine-N7 methyltransferase-like [Dysidea avara]|uniref:mRNA cap guanine-N7 methyltransferase-like n=1 Tax=Dysidea avara TaxID=196820 RepID=UPI00332F9A83
MASTSGSKRKLPEDNLPGKEYNIPQVEKFVTSEKNAKKDKSRIFYLRNFNNWVKSVLIRMHILQRDYTVLDMCCGKGGDLLKWKEGNISYLVGADIAATSIEQCDTRYNSDRMRGRHRQPLFNAEFHTADCTRVRLRDVYKNPYMRFNIASCQFSLQYCFESAAQAKMMLLNLCENLRPGGFLIGTTIDSNELVCRFRSSTEGDHMCGSSIYSAIPSFNIDDIPLFGAKYNFHLEGVVDVPEYLIHFLLLVRMLEEHNMELVLKQDFHEFFHTRQQFVEDVDLLYRMQALDRQTGEISQEEWDVIGLYLVFAFRKRLQ